MKLAFKAIDGFAKNPPANILAVLIYGPDEGLIRERMDILTKNIVADIHDAFNVSEFSADALVENPSKLIDETQSISMLGGRRVIRLRDASDKITGTVKELLAGLRPGDNLVLIAAGELPPKSTLRALFENTENVAALPCYVEDAGDIGKIISTAIRAAGYSISSDALAHMAANVTGDRGVARSEVEKLITYVGTTQKNITLDDAIACVGNSAALPLDDIAKNVATGNFAEAERILTYVLSEGVAAVTILRNLQNHFMKLHVTKSRIQQGSSVEQAMSKIKPPIFWKLKAPFEAQLMGWSLPQIEQAMSLLINVEAKCKQTANDPYTLCGRAILSLSQIGGRAMGIRRRG